MAVRSLAEWMRLPEIACPVIRDEASKGSIYTVNQIGFLAVPPSECRNMQTSEAAMEFGKYLFPTAEVEFSQKKQLCRLPVQLSEWAIGTVALAQVIGKSPFPLQVEFGILRDRYYAEML